MGSELAQPHGSSHFLVQAFGETLMDKRPLKTREVAVGEKSPGKRHQTTRAYRWTCWGEGWGSPLLWVVMLGVEAKSPTPRASSAEKTPSPDVPREVYTLAGQ